MTWIFFLTRKTRPYRRQSRGSFMSWISTAMWQHWRPRHRSTPPPSTWLRWWACVWAAPWTPFSVFHYSWSSRDPHLSSHTRASCSSHTSSCVTISRYCRSTLLWLWTDFLWDRPCVPFLSSLTKKMIMWPLSWTIIIITFPGAPLDNQSSSLKIWRRYNCDPVPHLLCCYPGLLIGL